MKKITGKLIKIKLLLLDVDGVLTKGDVIYDDNGGEIKSFNVKDGMGIKLILQQGFQICIVTGRSSKALRYRCKDLGINHIYEGVRDKAGLVNKISTQTQVKPEQMAFIGDDLPDLRIMKKVGLKIAVADAHEIVIENADYVTQARGGKGAVREVCEMLLKSQGQWEKLLNSFL